jgi:hypothetical protein
MDDGVDVEIARNLDHVVGGADVHRIPIARGVDRDGSDAEGSGGAHDAQGDLAAVGDQELLHCRHILKMP